MADIDRIVDVTITRQTTVPSVATFDFILIAAEFEIASVTPPFSNRTKFYSNLSDIATEFGTSADVYLAASAIFAQNPSVDGVYVGRKLSGGDGSETWDVALQAMLDEENRWYGLVCLTRTLADQQDIADWVESNKKLVVMASDDVNIPDGTGDIAEYIETQNYDRSAVIYHPDSDLSVTEEWPDAAWMGKMFPKDPGSATWALKTLTGVASYSLTGSQITTIEGKNGNYYTEVAGVDITQFGTVGSGEYIDIIRGTDWLEARIQELVFTPLIQLDKVPYTDSGVQIVVTQLKAALQEAADVGLITEAYNVTFPEVVDISASDKAARLLPDIKFTAIYAGAIHKVEIQGTISL